ncbi:hypothetical protein [Bdellovibrio sp. KM01]|uniref:hypothetical protein n=1 Tax=Bdellovibrio sp. KM01 TaxID=2748865 RepID=UPI0015E96990|nr:hypothetical protein [Bdellovibrio sp. KM01]QLY26971.1 hypothetical protein HW988_08245 [Bdellovibrio sp. KM01]
MKIFKNWILILISSLTLPFAAKASGLDCPISNNSCEFYRCMEQEQPCGKKGYWQNFGIPYCELFVKDESKFKISSQLWLQDVRLCLQERLRDTVEGLQCGDIKTKAIDDHVSCYVDTGFCQLPFNEQFKIMWYLKGALRDLQTWREAELLRRACQIP